MNKILNFILTIVLLGVVAMAGIYFIPELDDYISNEAIEMAKELKDENKFSSVEVEKVIPCVYKVKTTTLNGVKFENLEFEGISKVEKEIVSINVLWQD